MRYLIFLILFPTASLANEATQYFNAGYEHNVDTDASRIDIVTASMASGRSDIFWLYPEEPEQISYWKLSGKSLTNEVSAGDFSGQSVLLGYSYKATAKTFAELSLGYHEQTVDSTDETHAFGTGKMLTKALLLDDKLSLTASIEKDIEALTVFKRKVIYQINAQYKPKEKWRVRTVATKTDYSDDNERSQYMVEALYGISPGWPWIWAGAFYESLENTKDIAGYWTPDEFKNYGLKIEAAFPVYKEFQANTEFKFYRLKEESSDWGDGHTYSVGIQYGQRGFINFKLSFMDIESTQEGRKWSQDTTRFIYNQPF